MGYKKKSLQPGTPSSPSPRQKGNWGEKVAEDFLVTLGYAIRERQWRGQGFEIDLIAQKNDRIIFIEVKSRKTDHVDPALAVNTHKRQFMMRGADAYLKSQPDPFGYQFDIITIIGTEASYRIEHIPDAFFPHPRTKSR